ncbi:flagellar export chaperone FliS [Sinimarinibacterium thermocellulolyticum]|uniref:Flagellar secretion chaperone FliS n=1 Tax=Sinimarinibacterium thermocellulolyticum TaxID=3170016 RepID=A0ABV2AA42_9GAMM
MSYVALQHYRSTSHYAGVVEATPHKRVAMLYDGVIERLMMARGAVLRGEVAVKLRTLDSALAIVEHLRLGLDRDAGGAIARNLDALYDYIGRRLVEANARDRVETLDEVLALLRQLKSAWDGIAPSH